MISKKKQCGFSLIEVLVSLIVIGIGLLGLAGLQISSIKGTNNAHSRNVANNLALELSERMRANPIGVNGGFYENDISCSSNEPSQCKGTSFCTPERIARIDVQEIMCGVLKSSKREGGAENLLPNSTVSVDHNTDCDSDFVDDNETQISITWRVISEHKDQVSESDISTLEICVLP